VVGIRRARGPPPRDCVRGCCRSSSSSRRRRVELASCRCPPTRGTTSRCHRSNGSCRTRVDGLSTRPRVPRPRHDRPADRHVQVIQHGGRLDSSSSGELGPPYVGRPGRVLPVSCARAAVDRVIVVLRLRRPAGKKRAEAASSPVVEPTQRVSRGWRDDQHSSISQFRRLRVDR